MYGLQVAKGYYRVLQGTIGYSFRVLGRLGSPAVSRFYRVLQGTTARGTPGTHRGTHGYPRVPHRGTHGYAQVLAHAWAGFHAYAVRVRPDGL
jgi:hypothetical protein